MFVVAGDFNQVPYNLPDVEESNSFADFVSEQEEQYLRPLFGNLFYDALVSALNAMPATWVQPVDPAHGYDTDSLVVFGNSIWKSLIDDNDNPVVEGIDWTVEDEDNRWLVFKSGANYSAQGRAFIWKGMKAMVKPLIYSLWSNDSASIQTSLAVIIPTTENSEVVSPGTMTTKAWNTWHDIAVGVNNNEFARSETDSCYGYLVSVAASFNDLVTGYSAYDNFAAYLHREYKSPGRVNVFDI